MTNSLNSPCVGVCQIWDNKCKGCHRTMYEIVGWYDFSDEQKREVLERLENVQEQKTSGISASISLSKLRD